MDDLMADTKHEDDLIKVAFSVASHSPFGPVTVDTNIPYEVNYTNIGNGWNSAISAFRAPVDGLYVFSASMRSSFVSFDNAICHIVHTDSVGQSIVASMYGGFGEGLGAESGMSNSVIIELERDDYVSVQFSARYPDARLYSAEDEVYSTFSGFLLFREAY